MPTRGQQSIGPQLGRASWAGARRSRFLLKGELRGIERGPQKVVSLWVRIHGAALLKPESSPDAEGAGYRLGYTLPSFAGVGVFPRPPARRGGAPQGNGGLTWDASCSSSPTLERASPRRGAAKNSAIMWHASRRAGPSMGCAACGRRRSRHDEAARLMGRFSSGRCR